MQCHVSAQINWNWFVFFLPNIGGNFSTCSLFFHFWKQVIPKTYFWILYLFFCGCLWFQVFKICYFLEESWFVGCGIKGGRERERKTLAFILGLHGRAWRVGTATKWAIAKWPIGHWSALCDQSAWFRAMVKGRRENCRAYCLHSAQPALWRASQCRCRLCAAAYCKVLSLPGALPICLNVWNLCVAHAHGVCLEWFLDLDCITIVVDCVGPVERDME